MTLSMHTVFQITRKFYAWIPRSYPQVRISYHRGSLLKSCTQAFCDSDHSVDGMKNAFKDSLVFCTDLEQSCGGRPSNMELEEGSSMREQVEPPASQTFTVLTEFELIFLNENLPICYMPLGHFS